MNQQVEEEAIIYCERPGRSEQTVSAMPNIALHDRHLEPGRITSVATRIAETSRCLVQFRP
jgi:hypothetical protein